MVVSRMLSEGLRENLATGSSAPRKLSTCSSIASTTLSTDSSFEREASPLEERHKIGSFQAGVVLFKAICGPGILFLPAGVKNAGLLSAVILSAAAGATCTWCMVLVLDATRALRRQGKVITDFSELGEEAFGRLGRLAVDSAIVSSQLGFCTAYCIFVAENVQTLIFEGYGGMAATEGSGGEPCGLPDIFADKLLVYFIILVLIPMLIPFTWVRQIRYLACTNFIASSLVLSSILYMLISFAVRLHSGERSHSSPRLFAPSGTLVYFGTAVYAFEGISMLLPTERCMREPGQCKAVVCWTMGFVLAVQVTFATAAYLVYGEDTKSIITVSLSNGSALGGMAAVEAVQLAWVVEVLLTFPLQFFPAARLLEPAWFRKGSYRRRHSGQKWKKNGIRAGLLLLCMAVALGGYTSVDNLVALIGALSCVPLTIVYPALFHWRVMFAARSGGAGSNSRRGSGCSEDLANGKEPLLSPSMMNAGDAQYSGEDEDLAKGKEPLLSPSIMNAGYAQCGGEDEDGANGKETVVSPSIVNGEDVQCGGEEEAPFGGPVSDLLITACGTCLVLLSTVLAAKAWMTSSFKFQECILRP